MPQIKEHAIKEHTDVEERRTTATLDTAQKHETNLFLV